VFGGDPTPGKDPIYAGRLGVEYMDDAVLGLDPAGPALGLTARAEIRSWPEPPASIIPLVPGAGGQMPVTLALRDQHAPTATPALMLDAGGQSSYLTRSYVEKNWSGFWLRRSGMRALRKQKNVGLPLALPNGETVEIDVHVAEEPPRYVVPLGVDELHGVLGIDFIRRWMSVFDFPGRELLLFDYSASRSPSNQSAISSRR
jgi:hypothetical protein